MNTGPIWRPFSARAVQGHLDDLFRDRYQIVLLSLAIPLPFVRSLSAWQIEKRRFKRGGVMIYTAWSLLSIRNRMILVPGVSL